MTNSLVATKGLFTDLADMRELVRRHSRGFASERERDDCRLAGLSRIDPDDFRGQVDINLWAARQSSDA